MGLRNLVCAFAGAWCVALIVSLCATYTGLVGMCSAAVKPEPELIATTEPGWPQWRGPRRDGICDETNLLQNWPKGGPKLLWQVSGLGQGYSCPIISGQRLFITGDSGENLIIFAFDLNGRKLWQATNGASWKGPYPGSRTACAYARGRVLNMNAHGRVACLDSETGAELWAVNIAEKFGGKVNTWAYSECLLVDGERVYVTPGGDKALMAALELSTGKVLWTSAPLRLTGSTGTPVQTVAEPEKRTDGASYASPLLFRFGQRRLLVGCSLQHLFMVDAGTGQLLWARPLTTRYSVIASTPVLAKDTLFATAPDSKDAHLYRLTKTNGVLDTTTVWTTSLDTCHGGVIYLPQANALFGSWYRSRKGLACIELQNGRVRYELSTVAKGSLLFADKRFYYLSEEGQVRLLEPGWDGFRVCGEFQLVTKHKSDVWAHPVIHKERLFLRYHEALYCYDIGG